MPLVPSSYETLSAMITPAIFLTANGSLIISTSNRMSRIVDRIRALNDLGDRLDRGDDALDYPTERLEHVGIMLDRLGWRGERIRHALMRLYLAFGAFVGTSLSLALDVLAGNRLAALPTGLAVTGVTLMLGACVNLVREAMEALRGNRVEVEFFRDLRAAKGRRPSSAPGRWSGAGAVGRAGVVTPWPQFAMTVCGVLMIATRAPLL